MTTLAVRDRLENVAANLATGTAKTAGDRFALRLINANELDAMYRGDWIARKIIDLPVVDSLRPWRIWQASTRHVTAMEDVEKAHDIKAKVVQALKWARLYGGSAIFVSNGDADPSKPLTMVRKGGLQCLTALSRYEITPGQRVTDPRSPAFRAPEYYTLNAGDGAQIQVHHSRVIRFVGPERPDVQNASDGWGDSVLQIVYDAIHNAALSSAGVAELIHDAKVDVIQVKGLAKALSTPSGEALITKRFQLASALKSLNNMLLLGDDEVWERKQTSFAALPDILQTYMQIVAGAADIPAARLLGQSAKGLNATGEGDLANYYDALDGFREDSVRPALSRLDEVLWQHVNGSVPKNAYFRFAPLRQMSERESADLADKKADTTTKYANMGVFGESELRAMVVAQLTEDGTYPNIADVVDPADNPADDPFAAPDPADDPEVNPEPADDPFAA